MTCPACKSLNPAGSRFCESCGSRLGAEAPAPPPPVMPHATPPPIPVATPVAPKPAHDAPSYPAPTSSTTHSLPAAALRDSPVSVGAWIGILILLMIPLINLVMLLVWALGPNVNRSLQNFCRAVLILGFAVMIVSAALYLAVPIIGHGGSLP